MRLSQICLSLTRPSGGSAAPPVVAGLAEDDGVTLLTQDDGITVLTED